MASSKIVKLTKKPFRPHVATLITLVILIYVVFIFVTYVSKKHVSIYEVNKTKISDNSSITGVAVRDETVYRTKQDGFINFFHADTSKVAKNEVIYTIDSNNEISELLKKVESKEVSNINNIANMRELIDDYYNDQKPSSYDDISSFKYELENMVFEQSRSNLYSDFNKMMKSGSIKSEFTKVKTNKSGIVSYSIDGMEDLTVESVSSETFESVAAPNKNQLRSSEKVEEGTAVYKLVNSQRWSIVIPITEEIYNSIKDKKSIRVTIKKDGVSFNASTEFLIHGDARFVSLSTSRFMGKYLNDRYIDVQLNLNAADGLKIPKTSIITKELSVIPEQYITTAGDNDFDSKGVILASTGKFTKISNYSVDDGKYYVEKSLIAPGENILNPKTANSYTVSETIKVKGVYCVNSGYCQFKKIESVYENNEYIIISENTKGGIANFDHIVVNPDQISENDFIQ